ncbi:hypothetical protein [Microlunatus speluncae]|uniref:hypothetical protein n=1 Tax=Microlunatus speluncae TaxID=2594267 RepID=UPI0012666147|nr:hypothetical protein [Microlunatus speluncae]
MSQLTVIGTATPPTLAGLSRNDSYLPTSKVLEFAGLPMLITVITNVAFFVAYWLPEFGRGAADPLLGQLAPLASASFATGGEVWYATQRGTGTWLLIFGVAIAWLVRSRFWLARLIVFPISYLGAALALVMVVGLIVRGELFDSLLSVLLVLIWVAAAVVTAWRSLWQDLDDLPGRRTSRVWPLVLSCIAAIIPLAVGRSVFAPGLRDAASALAVDGSTMRWAALFTSATPRLYLAGVAVLVACWAFWRLLPSRRPPRPAATVVTLLISVLLGLGAIGMSAAQLGAERTAQITSGDPTPEMLFTCASWRQPGEGPARTLVAHGPGCEQLTGFTGFTAVSDRALGFSISPVKANLPGGQPIGSKVIGTEYDGVLVLAATDRVDDKADRVIGLRMSDGVEVWNHLCPTAAEDPGLQLRFARSPAGDDPAAGRLTDRNDPESVVVSCGADTYSLDPQTGTRLR